MSGSRTADAVAGGLVALALVAGVVQIFFWPFVFAAIATLALLTAIVVSPKHHRLYGLATALALVGFVVGTAIAVVTDNPLY